MPGNGDSRSHSGTEIGNLNRARKSRGTIGTARGRQDVSGSRGGCCFCPQCVEAAAVELHGETAEPEVIGRKPGETFENRTEYVTLQLACAGIPDSIASC